MADIHDRMPVILDEEKAREWLRPGEMPEKDVAALCASYPAEKMIKYPVSTVLNSSRNDVPECVMPVWTDGTDPNEFSLG